MPNLLSRETSPYLLQHANNPVDWYPWCRKALQKAKQENKLILVSVGYSACHWCHVMEHECFEDEEVAELMNQHYVSIKVDREERPDIDQIYMLAVQLMTGHGGWPLNCICLPDQRPIYGGTYFNKTTWMGLLQNLSGIWEQKPEEAREYAEKLTKGIHQIESLDLSDELRKYTAKDLEQIYGPWKKTFDYAEGGLHQAPKFPMPNNWQFLMHYAYHLKDSSALDICKVTLTKMAYGGIYDHIGGGFARYSVDGYWHIPHFEKMLYDNAQLISLYSDGYRYFKDDLHRKVVSETVDWLKREMTSPEGGFYSACDADSEGVEGKFYTFSRDELERILGEDAVLFCIYYNVTAEGNWADEHTNVLIQTQDESSLAESTGLSVEQLRSVINRCRQQVFEYREKRVRPGLDNKILASWNGLMIRGLVDAYRAFGEHEYLNLALRNGNFILDKLLNSKGCLRRLYIAPENRSKQDVCAFLEDYAFVIDAFTGLYEVTFDEKWLETARELTEYGLQNFYDPGTGMLFYTSQNSEELIARKHEVLDNVIPASNSAMALNLYRLGHFYDYQHYIDQARQMLANVFPLIKTYGPGYSNWGLLLFYEVYGLYEIAITGADYEEKRRELEKYFIPNRILLGGRSGSLPLLQDKNFDETTIYVCRNKTCGMPVTEVADALRQISSG